MTTSANLVLFSSPSHLVLLIFKAPRTAAAATADFVSAALLGIGWN
jgi:hypothetical protein